VVLPAHGECECTEARVGECRGVDVDAAHNGTPAVHWPKEHCSTPGLAGRSVLGVTRAVDVGVDLPRAPIGETCRAVE
jgi:hypothetical protein